MRSAFEIGAVVFLFEFAFVVIYWNPRIRWALFWIDVGLFVAFVVVVLTTLQAADRPFWFCGLLHDCAIG
jgi:hypothetical protein